MTNIEEKILQDIDWLRFKNSPIHFYYLENNIIIKFEKINQSIKTNHNTSYAIYDKNGNAINMTLYSSFEECLLVIALKLTSNDSNIINLLIKK